MATIRAYTTIEQSRKLAEFLPLESADMLYYCNKSNNIQISQYPFIRSFKEKDTFSYLSCWSLTALLRVIPKQIEHFNILKIDINEKDFSIWYDYSECGVNPELPYIRKEYAIDACVEMVLKLKELKLL